jgi:glycosyltransferase involved in cell wall biosynthesis
LRPAEDAYHRALALDNKVADTHLQLGHVLKLQRRPGEAVNAYRSAFRLDPDLTVAVDELRGMDVHLEATVEIEFVNRLYGLEIKNSQIKPSSDELLAFVESVVTQRPVYLNRQMLLTEHRLSLRLVDIFDEDFYFYHNKIGAANLPSPCFAKCLFHFCEVGIDRLMPFNADYIFDYQFYRDNFLIGIQSNERDAFRHWLSDGLDQGWAPNERLWLRDALGIEVFDPNNLYSLFDRKLGDELRKRRTKPRDADGFVKAITAGRPPNLPETADAAGQLTQIADLLATRGQDDAASEIYQRILYRFPESLRTLQHYADLLFRKGQHLAARALYDKARHIDGAGIWTYVNLAECLKLSGDYKEALAILCEGADSFSHDLGIRARIAQLADAFFSKEWDTSLSEARAGLLEDAQNRLAAACRVITPPSNFGTPLPRRIKSVAIIGNEELPQCRLYRIEQKIEQLRFAGYSVKLYDYNHRTQAAIFYRVPGLPKVISAIAKANELGIHTFYDIDDLIFDNSEYPDSFESYGGQITRVEYIGLCLGVPLFAYAMSMCGYGIASTVPLAQEMAKYVATGRVYTHRNAFGTKHEAYRAFRRRARDRDGVTIFYGSGTKAHKEDFEEFVVPALVETVRRYGNQVSIVIVGYVTITAQLRSIRENITLFDPIWNVDDYWQVLSEADINLAVLKPSLMADCKSEIKWLEAAMFAIPSIVSRTATYAEVIEDGVSGLLCTTQADWVAAIDRLVCDADLRQEMGLAAQRTVHKLYSLDVMATGLCSIFNNCQQALATNKPTVVIVNVFYPPQAFGGATRVVHDNVRHFVKEYANDFNVEVFTSIEAAAGAYETRSYIQDGVRITGVITPQEPDIDKRAKDQRMRAIFGEYLDSIDPALVHFHCIQRLTTSVVEAANERGIPYLITAHDGWWISDQQFIVDETGNRKLYDYDHRRQVMKTGTQGTYLRMTALREALFGAHGVLAVSDAFASVYKSCGVPNVISISNGVSDILSASRLRSPDGRVRIAFIGGMAVHKGYRLMRNAFLSDTFAHLTLTIVDHSRSRGYLRREVWGTTPVEFIGPLPQNEIGGLYSQTDVILAPSIWPESYGLVTREALACGCWVVASDRGAVGEDIANDENGYIIDVSDIAGLVRTLKQIDGDPLRYLGTPKNVSALRTAAEQSDALACLYNEILKGGKPPVQVITPRYAASQS